MRKMYQDNIIIRKIHIDLPSTVVLLAIDGKRLRFSVETDVQKG